MMAEKQSIPYPVSHVAVSPLDHFLLIDHRPLTCSSPALQSIYMSSYMSSPGLVLRGTKISGQNVVLCLIILESGKKYFKSR